MAVVRVHLSAQDQELGYPRKWRQEEMSWHLSGDVKRCWRTSRNSAATEVPGPAGVPTQSWRRTNSDGPSTQGEGVCARGAEVLNQPERNSSGTIKKLARAWSLGASESSGWGDWGSPKRSGEKSLTSRWILGLNRKVSWELNWKFFPSWAAL